MTSFEGLREQRQSQTTTTVPTLAQRQGDFSQTFAQNGQLIRIFDPFSTRANPAGGFIRDQFAGNVIPANRMDPGRAQRAQVLPAAEPGRECRDRRAELLRDRHRRAERRQHRRPRRSPALGQPEDVRALLVPQDVQRAGHLLPRRHRHRRGAGQRTEPRPQLRHRLQPHDVEHHGAERAARVRADAVHLRQPGPGLQAVEPRAADVDRRQRRSADVPALRRRRHGDARRQRSPLQRVHELHRRRQPDQGARRARAEGRLRRPHAARQRLGGAQRRHVQLPHERDAGAESHDRQQHRRLRLRVVPARLRPAQRRADPELEERRGQQLLLGGLRAGRLAHQHRADRSTSASATTSTCRARSATTG